VSYSLTWSDPALDQLADAYLAARIDGRDADFSQSISQIEANLTRDPLAFGESRAGAQRVMFDSPAMVLYQVDQSVRVVNILAVRYVP
jgi:hypothetical protein